MTGLLQFINMFVFVFTLILILVVVVLAGMAMFDMMDKYLDRIKKYLKRNKHGK